MHKEGMEFPQGKLEEQIMVKIFGGSRMSENKGADFTCEEAKLGRLEAEIFKNQCFKFLLIKQEALRADQRGG